VLGLVIRVTVRLVLGLGLAVLVIVIPSVCQSVMHAL